jgi:hypothetical protein
MHSNTLEMSLAEERGMFRSAVKLVAVAAICLVGFLFVTQSYGEAGAAAPVAAEASTASTEWALITLIASGVCLLLIRPRRRSISTKS